MAQIKSTTKKSSSFRQPVVAVMGHVDHGKTSFLDAIRGARVVDKEAGGITQNTRAHEVSLKSGNKITFIDTPGHEAFSAMRKRGAQVTDFVLLIVAADDGLQPQTKESIQFAKDNNVPIIVAINKIDIEGVKIEKVKQQLSSFDVLIEEYGGDTLCFEISATKKIGLNELLDGIELLAEVNELKPNVVKEGSLAEAFVLESILDKNIGNIAVCILKAGKLEKRVFGVTKDNIFKVRAYLNEELKQVSVVKESSPVWITGLKSSLNTGDKLYFVEDEKQAKLLQQELNLDEKAALDSSQKLDAASLFAQMLVKREEKKQGINQKELNIIVKTSTKGTLEAVVAKLSKLETTDAKVKILYSETGDVTEEDIFRAKAAKAIIVSFQQPPRSNVMNTAKTERVLVRNYEIIYELFDEITEVLGGLADNFEEEIEIAKAKIKQVFVLSDGTAIAGSEVLTGTFVKGYKVWVERGEMEVGRGKVVNLRQGKNEVREVKKGLECGIMIDQKLELQEGDLIVAYRVEK